MYNLLVVDDEEIAVKGIVHSIDWSEFPLAGIYSAYDVAEAKSVFARHKIHILLSDIDMPDDNGIALLKWVRETSVDTETIFLTGHADFSYAQQALQLDSFDYLLKPIDHEHLKATLHSAIDKIKKQEEMTQFQQTYEHYYQQWNKQLPILAERFWQDIINLRIPMSNEHLDNAYSLYGIPLQACDEALLVLISVEEWNDTLSARDEEIMTYAVKNAGEEMVLDGLEGQVIQDVSGVLYAVVYKPQAGDTSRLQRNCAQFIEKCKQYLRCSISCYIGESTTVPNMHNAAERLVDIERNHLGFGEKIVLQRDYKKEAAGAYIQPNFAEWASLLDSGRHAELVLYMKQSFVKMDGNVDVLVLEGYYHGLVYMVFQTLQKRSLSMEDVYRDDDEWRDAGTILRSLPKMKEWALRFVEKAALHVSDSSKDMSSIVQKALQYIEEHLHEEFSREDIASYVFLNPAYLSRLFKKETGHSLSDYILDRRIAKVRALLENTNMKISDVIQTVSYYNTSHFSKMFKRTTGLTPAEYRKKHQNL